MADSVVAYRNSDNTQVSVTSLTPLPTSGTTSPAPTSAATSAITPLSTSVAAGSLVLKASAGNLYGFEVTTGGSAGYVMIFNATSAPADGTVTPVKTFVVAANATVAFAWDTPLRFSTGITVVFSTTGPFTKTISATAFISGQAV